MTGFFPLGGASLGSGPMGFGVGPGGALFMGPLEGILYVLSEEDGLIGGLRLTRTRADFSKGDTAIGVESVVDWDTTAEFFVNGIRHRYASRTNVALSGIEYFNDVAWVSGFAEDGKLGDMIVDHSLNFSAIDEARRQVLVDYATGENLDTVGSNLGVLRSPLKVGGSTDDEFREVIKALAYAPRGTWWALELAFDAIFGAGNYRLWEHPGDDPFKVYFQLKGALDYSGSEDGKAFIQFREQNIMDDSTDVTLLGAGAAGVNLREVGNVSLWEDEFYVDDFGNFRPSAYTYIPLGGAVWTYVGADELTRVLLFPAWAFPHCALDKQATGEAVTYEHILNCPHEGSDITASWQMAVGAGTTVEPAATEWAQVAIKVANGEKTLAVGIRDDGGSSDFVFGVFDPSTDTLISGGTLEGTIEDIYDIEISMEVDGEVSVTVNGIPIPGVPDYSSLPVAPSNDNVIVWGCFTGYGNATTACRVFGAGHSSKNTTEYWNSRGTGRVGVGEVGVSDRITAITMGSPFAGAVVGDGFRTYGSTVTNSFGGNNDGEWEVKTAVSGITVDLQGKTYTDSASTDSTLPTQFTIEEENFYPFEFPRDLGKKLEILEGVDAGTYRIAGLLRDDGTEITAPGLLRTDNTIEKARIVRLENVGGGDPTLSSAVELDWRLMPDFDDENPISWELAGAGTVAGDVLTLPAAINMNRPGSFEPRLDVNYARVPSAHLVWDTDIDGNPPDYYAFYFWDAVGILRPYLDDLTVAGVELVQDDGEI